MNIDTTICKNCNQSLRRLMCLALLEDAGAKVYPNANYCAENQEHDFAVATE